MGPLIAPLGYRSYIAGVPRTPFIEPSAPVLGREPPIGREWIHGPGGDLQLQRRRPHLQVPLHCAAVEAPPCQSTVIDAELVACDVAGKPSCGELLTGARHGCCAWCFDLMELDGTNHIMAQLEYRRHLLSKLLKGAKSDTLRMSENFRDPVALLRAAETHGLEGIVSKLKADRYRSGKNTGWIKVKTAAWRAANRDRWEMFQRAQTDRVLNDKRPRVHRGQARKHS